jgi:MraZ protein
MVGKFRGSHKAKIDHRGRIKIPSRFLTIFQEGYENKEVYITSINGNNVLIYPINVWEDIEEKTSKEIMNPKVNRFTAKTSFWGIENIIDQRGRILIRGDLRQEAHFKDEVLFIGKINHIEIWNNETFINENIKHEFTDQDMAEIASLLNKTN